MLRQALHDRLRHPLFLLYSNRHPENAAFSRELQALARQHRSFRLDARMTAGDGRISDKAIRNFVGEAVAPVYYLAGPPAFVDGLTDALLRYGVTGDALQSEMLYGY